MKKIVATALLIAAVASNSFATYMVILKNGTRYRAKAKWTIQGGKAFVELENGTTLQLDPALIDVAESEKLSKSGLGDVKILNTNQGGPAPDQPEQPSLGSITKLRKPTTTTPAPTTAPVTQSTSPAAGGSEVGSDVLSKFSAAYDNVGLFDARVVSVSGNSIRVALTADNEDKVFKAISATSYVLHRIKEVTGKNVSSVELLMGTINGSAAGRFQMSTADAAMIENKQLTLPLYFVKKVIY